MEEQLKQTYVCPLCGRELPKYTSWVSDDNKIHMTECNFFEECFDEFTYTPICVDCWWQRFWDDFWGNIDGQ